MLLRSYLFLDISVVRKKNANVHEVHGGRGFGRRNLEGERILEFAVAYNLVVSNSLLTKRQSHLVKYQSKKNQSQIDWATEYQISAWFKVTPNKECVTQYKLFICDAKL